MSTRLGGCLALAALLGCQALEPAPSPGPGRSFILVFGKGTDAEILASDAIDLPFAIGGDAPVRLFVYETPLADLFLMEGPIEALDPRAPGTRALPPTPATFQLATQDPPSWRPLVLPDPELPAIPAVLLPVCAANGGCFASLEDRAAGNCKKPCPEAPVAEPMPPAGVPAAPNFLPCPAGWIESSDEGSALCRPPARVPSCPDAQFQPVASDRCEPIGEPCPSGGFGRWPEDGRRRVHVDPQAPPGGNGDVSQPYDQLGVALLDAGPNDVVLLAAGTIRWLGGALDVAALVGACTASTTLSISSMPISITATIAIQDLTLVSESPANLIDVLPTSVVQLARVMLGSELQQPDRALLTSYASVRGERVRVRARELGFYLGGGSLELSSTAIEVPGGGLASDRATRVRLDQFWVRTATSAVGVSNGQGSSGLTNGLIEGSGVGVYAGANTRLERIQLQHTDVAVAAYADDATLSASQVLIEDSGNGFSLRDERGHFEIEDVVVLDGREPRLGLGGGIEASGLELHLQRALVARARDQAIVISATASVSDVRISAVSGHGRGLDIFSGTGPSSAQADVEHVWIEGAAQAMSLEQDPDDPPFAVQLRDVVLDRNGDPGQNDRGLSVGPLGALAVQRISVRGFREGMAIDSATQHIQMSDVNISAFNLVGMLLVEPLAEVVGANDISLARVRIAEGSGNAGLDLRSSWRVTATDLDIHELRGANTSVTGVLADTGQLSLTNFSITDVTGAAFTARNDPALAVRNGRVDDCAIVLLGSTLAELMVGVRLDGNGALTQ